MTPAEQLVEHATHLSYDELRDELATLLNSKSMENRSNTPDFILADYLVQCLIAFDDGAARREKWYGRADEPGTGV